MTLPRLTRPAGAFFLSFAVIALLMVTHVTDALDVAILQAVGSWRTPALTSAMRAAEFVGDGKVEIPLALLVCALLWIRGRSIGAWRYFGVCLSAEALYLLAKLAFHRQRPTVIPHLGQGGWYSFPSGHAMLAPVIWGLGLVLLAQLVNARAARIASWIAAVTICATIAACRVYLGVHYPSDVLGGICLGMAWVLWWWNALHDQGRAAAATN